MVVGPLLAAWSLAHVAVAYRMPMPVARMAVRNYRASSISMVIWESVPADSQWTKVAWEQMGLTSDNMHACISIPDGLVPDQGWKRSRTWYFCTFNGAEKAGMPGIELPTYSPEAAVFLCSVPHGARPSFAE